MSPTPRAGRAAADALPLPVEQELKKLMPRHGLAELPQGRRTPAPEVARAYLGSPIHPRGAAGLLLQGGKARPILEPPGMLRLKILESRPEFG